jgi:Peptidase propeptide and YPEB domain
MQRMVSVQATVLTMLLTLSLPAVAQVASPLASSPGMNLTQMIEHVAGLGYRDIKEVEKKSDKLFEVKARDPNGNWVELYIDSRSGEILGSKVKKKP